MDIQMNIFDYVATYNTQNPDKLEELDKAQLDRMGDETYEGLGAGPDLEKALNQVIDLQERMAKGSKLIEAVQAKLDHFQENRVPYEVFMAHVDKIKKLKAHWWKLKGECDAIIGPNRQVWGMYFGLINEELTEYFTWGGNDVTEDLAKVDSRHAPSDEIYRDEHIKEMAVEELDFNENPYLSRDWWDEWSFNRRENERLEMESLQAMSSHF